MKKIITALIAAAIALAAVVCVSAKEEYPLSLSYSDGYVTWEETSPSDGIYNTTLIAAASENGVLTKAKVYEHVYSKVFVNDDFYNGEQVKFMLWNGIDGMEPMSQFIEETITGAKDAPVSVLLKASDFDCNNSAYENGYIEAGKLYFLSGGQTQEYALSDDVKLKINGFEYTNVNEGIGKYIVGNDMSDIVLTDYAGEDGSLDNVYDEISVDYYITMVVDNCHESPLGHPTASIDALYCETGEKEYWDLDFARKSYKFIKDGREISISDIAVDDILLIKCNVSKDIDDSSSYEVLVSSQVLKSEISAYNEENNTYTIDGKEYALKAEGALEIGTKYKLYIDSFGKIVMYEELGDPKQLAIIDEVYTLANGDTAAKLILSDGAAAEYVIKRNDSIQAAWDIVYADKNELTKNPVCDRVIEYSLNQADELYIKSACEYKKIQNGLYQREFQSINDICFSDETVLFDSYGLIKIKENVLVDNYRYTVYAYDYDAENKVYRMILFSGVEKGICAGTKMAIFKGSVKSENGTEYIMLVGNEEKQLPVEQGAEIDLTTGDAVLYATNLDGEIKEIEKLFSDTADISDGEAFVNMAFENTEQLIKREYVKGLSTQADSSDLIFGAVTDCNSGLFCSISPIKNNLTNTIEAKDIFYEDVNVYEIDYNEPVSGERVKVSTTNTIVKPHISSSAYVDRTTIDWSKLYFKPKLVLAKFLDGDATDIYIIIPKKD